MITVAAVALILLHMIDGRIVLINPKQVTQLLSSLPGSNKVLPDARAVRDQAGRRLLHLGGGKTATPCAS